MKLIDLSRLSCNLTGIFLLLYQKSKNNINIKIMIYGYIRVSSDKQTVENQRFEITKFCEAQNLVINDWIEETISGAKITVNDNLADCLGKVCEDDIIICSELSRLGRNLFMIVEILNICIDKRVSCMDNQR